MGTFVSVLTFEKVILTNHTAKYEIIGKDLQRRIEQSLKFGKRLDRFVGMDGLVTPLFQQAEDLCAVHITDTEGNIFFSFRGRNTSDSRPSGERLHKNAAGAGKLPFPPRQFLSEKQSHSRIALFRNDYYILFPIEAAYGREKGVLALTFGKEVLDRKKTTLIKSAAGKLLLSLGATAVLMTFLVRLLIIRPLRRETEKMIRGFQQDPVGNHGKTPSSCDEIGIVYERMRWMKKSNEQSRDELGAVIEEIALQIDGMEEECTLLPPLQKVLGRRRHGA